MVGWSERQRPGDAVLQGLYCRLEPLDASRHAPDLFDAFSSAPDHRDWTYMTAGPFGTFDDYFQYAQASSKSVDPKFYAVVEVASGKAIGSLTLMRQDPANGVVEVGNVMFSPLLQRRPTSTESQFLLMQYVFEVLKYRRYEWKCDSFNLPSRKAAERLGFSFEGIFRQAVIYKGRSRDTAWFAITDADWPAIRQAFQKWLSAANFDGAGHQIRSLTEIRATLPLA